MTERLAHRGPDGEGYHVDDKMRVFLGHRRLAILDLDCGAQPMWNETGDVGVVYNGEIYNHSELRAELELHGHRFSTNHSDTEVLVHGYEQWGRELPARLNGMFAFAIYDERRQQIFCARDRFGEKPLYYFEGPNLFAFASELDALTAHSAIARNIDLRALQKYFAYGYLPAPWALFQGCRKLPGGGRLVYDLKEGHCRTDRHWEFFLEPDESITDADEAQLIEELRHLLRQAVERRLISDVPIGFFLSGGIDSSAVVRFAKDILPPEKIETFTIGFREASYDESPHAQRVAEQLGLRHHKKILDLDEARGSVAAVLNHLDEPLGDASILPTSLLSRFTRENVTVALSGDGGDELFAGYDPFRALKMARIYDRFMPAPFHKLARLIAEQMPPSGRNLSFEFKLKRTLLGLSYRPALWNSVWMSMIEPAEVRELFDDPLPVEELYSEALQSWNRSHCEGILDRSLEFFTRFYLPDDILVKVDRATMQWSLESRAVFLDNDLVDFCCRLPSRFKYRNGVTKYLLKRALTGLLPDDILHRPKKGFGIPAAAWLRHGLGWPGPRLDIEGVDLNWARRRWQEHSNGRRNDRLFLWAWMSLENCLEGEAPGSAE